MKTSHLYGSDENIASGSNENIASGSDENIAPGSDENIASAVFGGIDFCHHYLLR